MARPREEGVERYPSGKKKPAATLLPGDTGRAPISGALWQRMLADGEKIFGDARFGTELARLGAVGQLTPSEVATGFRVAGIYGRFEYYKGLRRSAPSPHYIREFIAEGTGGDADAPGLLSIENRERTITMLDDREAKERDATLAFRELQEILPHEFRGQVERLCVENEHVGYQGLVRARIGLAIIREYFTDKDAGGVSKKARKKQRKLQRAPLKPAPAPATKIDPFKDAFFAVQRKINPHLGKESLEWAWSTLCALKARSDFRRAKSERSST